MEKMTVMGRRAGMEARPVQRGHYHQRCISGVYKQLVEIAVCLASKSMAFGTQTGGFLHLSRRAAEGACRRLAMLAQRPTRGKWVVEGVIGRPRQVEGEGEVMARTVSQWTGDPCLRPSRLLAAEQLHLPKPLCPRLALACLCHPNDAAPPPPPPPVSPARPREPLEPFRRERRATWAHGAKYATCAGITDGPDD